MTKNVCQYYRNGYCVSPLLEKPTDFVTDSSRCMGNYFTCRFYPSVTVQGDKEQKREEPSWNSVNLLDKIPVSGCPYFEVNRTAKGVIARCKLVSRILTRSQVNLCVERWMTCPFAQ